MKSNKKKLVQEIVKQAIDTNTGEVLEVSSVKSFTIDREPDFIKIYTDDILRLKDIPKGMNSVLISLLKRMNYQNEVYVISHVKKEMEIELSLSEVSIRKSLELFVQKEVLIRKHRGVYIFDPLLVARGSWEDIHKLRLTITYEKGKAERTIKAEFEA
jgi:hypothetical protein